MKGHTPLMIIPAAGFGTRLQSRSGSLQPAQPKLLVEVNGRPMIDWLLDLYEPVIDAFILVLNPSFDAAVREHCRARRSVAYAYQETPTGMLDAVIAPIQQADAIHPDRIWITWCDQIGIDPKTRDHLATLSQRKREAALIFPTTVRSKPYIHIARDSNDRIAAIHHRREGDDMPDVGESDMGLFSLSPDAYFQKLPAFKAEGERAARTGERNFLPFIPWLSRGGATVLTFSAQDEREAIGINTAEDLETVAAYLRERKINQQSSVGGHQPD